MKPYVLLRHPEKHRRFLHRLVPEETVRGASRAAAIHFGIKANLVIVDPYTGARLPDQRRCPSGEYDLEYE